MVTIVLHTHIPHVLHHGTWPHGSDWLCEAVAECYLPLLRMCDRLLADGIRPAITFDISPVLCEQLAHPDFPELFENYCRNHEELAAADAGQFERDGHTEQQNLAKVWVEWYQQRCDEFVQVYGGDIVGAFKSLQDRDAIEILTCGATHGYLPLLAEDASVDLQIRLAVANYKRHFGRTPRGIWLPECAYRPAYPWRTFLPIAAYSVARQRDGVEHVLVNHQLEYFITDEGALSGSTPLGTQYADGKTVSFEEIQGTDKKFLESRPPTFVFQVASSLGAKSVAVFTRNRNVALQVWSGDTGYPGDPDYLDFHKKYFQSSLRYWRVTDNKADMQYKQLYVPEWAEQRTKQHAQHYVDILELTARYNADEYQTEPTICLPFDAELFGHWWFEGPLFLEHVLRGINSSTTLSTCTTSERLDVVKPHLVIALPESSWGKNGNHDVWMNPEVQWTWEKEYRLEHRLRKLIEKHSSDKWDETMRRLMLNVFRQMLLAQASDWQFLITTASSKEYAQMRFHNHVTDADALANAAEKYSVSGALSTADNSILEACEVRDSMFEVELQEYIASYRS